MRSNKHKTLLSIIISVILLFGTKQSLGLLNVLFYIGLVSFIVAGFLLVINKGIFNRMFRSFKRFYQNSSKVEEYVSAKTPNITSRLPSNGKSYIFVKWLLGSGILLIAVTTVSALFFHS